jgi:hypothetical protein
LAALGELLDARFLGPDDAVFVRWINSLSADVNIGGIQFLFERCNPSTSLFKFRLVGFAESSDFKNMRLVQAVDLVQKTLILGAKFLNA